LRLLAEVREIYTVPDAVLARYRSRTASGLAAAAVLVGTVGYLGAQLLALGILLDGLFGFGQRFGAFGLPLAMAAGGAAILFYSVAGGMIAGVYTDLVQGALMVGVAVAVFARAWSVTGGLFDVASALARDDRFGPDFLDPVAGAPLLTAFGFFFVFSIGTLGQPHMLHKFYMLRDPAKLKWLPLVIAVSQSLCLLIWVGVGLAVPALVVAGDMPALADPDTATPAFVSLFTPGMLGGLVLAGVVAAVMSTADSFVNVGAAALVRDLPRAFGRRVSDELTWGRWTTAGLLVASGLFALVYGDLIALLGTFAFGTFAAALVPALAVGLNWKRVPAAAAVASIGTGLGLNLVLEFLGRQTLVAWLPGSPLPPGALPTAVSLVASFTVLFAVTYLHKGDEPIDDDVAAVMEA